MNLCLISTLVSFSLLLRFFDYYYYRDSDRILQMLRLEDRTNIKIKLSYYKKYDNLFCIFPFIWSWVDILTAAFVVSKIKSIAVLFLMTIFVATRFRALQEASHTAVHYGLCKSKKWQWALSNIFFQYPCFKPDMFHRQIAHVVGHHKHVNDFNKDPNIVRFISVGMLPNMTKLTFYIKLFHSLTLSGISETIKFMWQGASLNNKRTNLIVRLIVIMTIMISFIFFFGYRGLIFVYFLPLITIYPWFSWLSLLAEHRWFINCTEKNYHIHECINGRPTDYEGLGGWIIKHAIFPGTDHYHLAHSLYPFVRWNYMKAIDKKLKEKDSHYKKYLSNGLLFSKNDQASALSELKDRMTSSKVHDLAPWVKKLIEAGAIKNIVNK